MRRMQQSLVRTESGLKLALLSSGQGTLIPPYRQSKLAFIYFFTFLFLIISTFLLTVLIRLLLRILQQQQSSFVLRHSESTLKSSDEVLQCLKPKDSTLQTLTQVRPHC